jgi:ATP-binding cassette, subfamily B, bacterial PglK
VIVVFIILTFSILNFQSSQGLLNTITLFIASAYRLLPSLNKCIISLNNLKSYEFTFNILRMFENEENIERPEHQEPLHFENKIELRNISFKYEKGDKHIVRDLNLTINKGESIGIIGTSGSGKTTLINILLRFLNETKGNIYVDNQALNADNLLAWREKLGYVKQNVFLFDANVYENIAIGLEENEIDKAKVERIVNMTLLDDLIHNLPNGYYTQLGESGSKLSGGQRQRFAIARALYHDAEILIFDEATSALDNETELEITKAIDLLSSQNKTIITIAHRYSTLKNCNKIYEMYDGKIIDSYSYDELLKSKNY